MITILFRPCMDDYVFVEGCKAVMGLMLTFVS